MAPLRLVEVPHAHEGNVLWQDRGRRPAKCGGDAGEHRVAVPQQMSERHPVHVTASGRLRRVRVAVRVQPDEANALPALRERGRGPRDGPRSDGMIATDRDRHRTGDDRVCGHARELRARHRDRGKEDAHGTGAIARLMPQHFRQRRRHVVVGFDDVSQRLETPREVRHPER